MNGEVCIVTGAGRGIGLEAARSLAWLGARVVIAEIDPATGAAAEAQLRKEFGERSALFIRTDVSSSESVRSLAIEIKRSCGHVSAVLNNATAFRMGAVTDVSIEGWDLAYGVNLRGPVLMAQAFLPEMVARDHGRFICVSSSGAAPYMGAYEVFKTAQVELARVLDAEMEGRNVHVLTIGPGLVHTPGSDEGIAALAPLYNKSVDEFFAMSRDVMLTAEEAGAGFAAAVAAAERFRGQEISSFAALSAYGITVGNGGTSEQTVHEVQWTRVQALVDKALSDLEGQYKSWMGMVVFKRQWILRDFKKGAGMPVEMWLDALRQLKVAIETKDASRIISQRPPFEMLIAQYSHMLAMLKDYEKDSEKLKEGKVTIEGWIRTLEELVPLI
ncbi:MAG: SDR family oxidoreductase [Methanomassiliicoccus sp.]|nr:SDR family oxidoreductase [Methanomassiliicoccus sp.]